MTSEKLEREAIQALRRSYGEVGLPEFSKDPFELFHAWLKAAVETPVIVEANALVLSTVDGNQPSSRTVQETHSGVEDTDLCEGRRTDSVHEMSPLPSRW